MLKICTAQQYVHVNLHVVFRQQTSTNELLGFVVFCNPVLDLRFLLVGFNR